MAYAIEVIRTIILFLALMLLLPVAYSNSDRSTEMEPITPESEDHGSGINLNIFDALSDVRHIIGNVIGKIISKKRIVGLDSDWYW